MEKRRLGKITGFANVFLAGGAIGSVLALSYFVYHYAWVQDRQFVNFTGVVLYYGLPLAVAALLFACLRLRSVHKTGIVILCGCLSVSAYALETFISVVKSQQDELLKRDMFADLQRTGVVPGVILPIAEEQADGSMQPAVRSPDIEMMPLGGVSNKLTSICQNGDQYLIYSSDEHGFHNPTGLWHPGLVEIAALGNSWTSGWCVDSDKNYVAHIRKRYPATLNLGMAGEGPLEILAVTKEYLQVLKPNTVLWFYFEGNSLVEMEGEQRSPLLLQYLKEDFNQNLIARQGQIDEALSAFFDRKRNRHQSTDTSRNAFLDGLKLGALRARLGMLSVVETRVPDHSVPVKDSTLVLFEEILSQVKENVNTWGGKLYFVYLPQRERYALANLPSPAEQRTRILNMVRDLDIPLIDIHPVFQAQSDPLDLFPFRTDYHYGENGHRLVAAAVLNALSTAENQPQHAGAVSK